MQLLANFLA